MEGAPEPEMEMESNRPRAPRTASSLPQQESQGRPCWVCVPPDDLGTAGPGLRRKTCWESPASAASVRGRARISGWHRLAQCAGAWPGPVGFWPSPCDCLSMPASSAAPDR